MRFTVAAAVLATSAMASEAAISTDYATQLVTVIDCPPEVTNCPAHEKTTAVITSVVPLTTSTVLSTKVHTITSCAPDVPDCPAHSTVYSTETIAVSTTICPVGEVTETPTHYANNTIVPSYTKPGPGGCNGYDCPPVESSNLPHGPTFTTKIPVGPAPTSEGAACESTSVTAITKSYTTVLTTVEYSTIVGACPTGPVVPGAPKPSGSVVPPPAEGCNGADCPKPTTPAEGCTGANCTTTTPPPVTAGAASFAGSAIFAVVAGVAAFAFA
ncbi:Fc.00g108960.m01.CDS01 [Cosmosporella sp. VM-42]